MGGSKNYKQLDRIMNIACPDDAINIQFTSRTTGLPKGATLTHFNILNNSFFIGNILGYSEKDVICVPVPLYNCFGMVLGNLCAINFGSTVVMKVLVQRRLWNQLQNFNLIFLENVKEYESNPPFIITQL
ncbi:hypothetical protein ABPG72_006229 [Tetrahymena utriculariae]